MPTTDKIQWPQGQPQFEAHWRAITEALGGNGVVSSGDFKVTATATDMEIQVASGTAFYNGSTHSLGSASTFTLSTGGSDDRWDAVYFDTSTDSAGVRQGTAAANPEPPDIQGDEILLATVYVAASATNVTDSEILNWRTHSMGSGNTRLTDSNSEFSSATVDGALNEVIREQGDPLNGPLDLSSFSGSAPLDLGTNPTTFGAIVDMVVDSNSTSGTTHSYYLAVDSTSFLEIQTESDGAGGIQNSKVILKQLVDVDGDIRTTGGTTIWDSANTEVPQAQLGGPASSLTSYPIPIGDLNSPYGLPNITDMDASGNDLTDSSGPGTLYESANSHFRNEVVQALANFTNDETFSAYPLVIGTDVESDIGTDDLTAESSSVTVFNNTDNWVPRGSQETDKNAITVSSNTTTSGEEVVRVDSSSGTFTITLASADVVDGRTITIVDDGDNANNNNINISAEGGEAINGPNSTTISTAGGYRTYVADGSGWREINSN